MTGPANRGNTVYMRTTLAALALVAVASWTAWTSAAPAPAAPATATSHAGTLLATTNGGRTWHREAHWTARTLPVHVPGSHWRAA
jgi:hypothetical protein